MAAWLIAALALVRPLIAGAGRLIGSPAGTIGTLGLAAETTGAIDIIPGFGPSGGFGSGLFGGGGGGGLRVGRPRRRKKALTQTDLATALTISSAISKKAAENFILMRVRR